MRLSELEKSVRNNPKFTGIYWASPSGGQRIFGFKLNRKNSHVYYNFIVWGEDENAHVFFDHKYSQRTGKKDKTYSGSWSIIKQLYKPL